MNEGGTVEEQSVENSKIARTQQIGQLVRLDLPYFWVMVDEQLHEIHSCHSNQVYLCKLTERFSFTFARDLLFFRLTHILQDMVV